MTFTSTINFFFDEEYKWMFNASPFKYGLFITCVSFRATWCGILTVVPCTVNFLFSHLVNKLVTLNQKLFKITASVISYMFNYFSFSNSCTWQKFET